MTPHNGSGENSSINDRHSRIERVAAMFAALDPLDRTEARLMGERLGGLPAPRIEELGKTAMYPLAAQGTAPRDYPGEPARSPFELTLENVEQAMRYQPWNAQQVEQGDQVREALTTTAKTILRLLPRSPIRTRVLNELINLRMLANQAISFPWGF
jgi:hypothetical protein